MDASIRFRIQVPCSSQIKKAWCYSNYHGETIRDLLVKIVNELRLDLDPSRLSATIDGFALIPSSEVRLVVRENDLIT